MTRKILRILFLVSSVALTICLLDCGPRKENSGTMNVPDDGGKRKPREEATADSLSICNKIKAIKDPAPLGATQEFTTRFLDAHNEIRRLHDLPLLTWDDSLAHYAQRWAQHLKDNNQCKMQHRSAANITENRKLGENLGLNYQSPESLVKAWSLECEHYNYSQNTCSSGKACGHYTQVVWQNTSKVGCGMIACDKGRMWVCNYDPPGNYVGKWPY